MSLPQPGRQESTPVIGYVPGVFDMFHVGHLTLISRAREHCDRLVVGVVTDDVVEQVKGRAPVIPLLERMEIVSALRFVDEVVADRHVDKYASWQQFGFDVLFKGDDWQGTPKGERLEADLGRHGARVHYFPYTTHVSSTIIRAARATAGLAAVP